MTEGIIQQIFTKFYGEMTPCVEISELRSLEKELIEKIKQEPSKLITSTEPYEEYILKRKLIGEE